MIKQFELYSAYNSEPYFTSNLLIEYNSYKNGTLSFINKLIFRNLEISSNTITINNNYHCKRFLLGWRAHLRNLMPNKLVQLDNENQYNIYDIMEYIKNDKSKKKGIRESKYIYYIVGVSELRVYIDYDRTLVKMYDRCGESTILLTHDNILDSRENYIIKATLYKKYKEYIHIIDELLKSFFIC